jgi:hypothetical protein
MSANCPHLRGQQRAGLTAGALARTSEHSLLLVRIRCGAVMDDEHDVNSEPMSIARCREILGDEAVGLSDSEVDQIRRHAEAMAHVIIGVFLDQSAAQD